jgi:hypothetical protein
LQTEQLPEVAIPDEKVGRKGARRAHELEIGLEGNKRVLWTMSDEKWWFGLVSRTFAKMCPALGIAKEVFAVHHKKHISKVT